MQLDKSEGLYTTKLWLLEQLNIAARPIAWHKLDMVTAAAAARVLCLRQEEVEQLQGLPDLQQPINPRNEAAALALLVSNGSVVCGSSPERQQQLQELAAAYPHGGPAPTAAAAAAAAGGAGSPQSSGSVNTDQTEEQRGVQQAGAAAGTGAGAGAGAGAAAAAAAYGADSPEQQLYSWVLSQGASSQVIPAAFPLPGSSRSSGSSSSGPQPQSEQPSTSHVPPASSAETSDSLRGCAATADLPAGSDVISLPAKLLITYRTAAESDFGRVLTKIGLDLETLAVVWTMVERWDAESAARAFWQALPRQFNTGLSVPQPLVDLLKGTPLHQELTAARQHVQQQFKDLQQTFQVLLQANPSYLQESWFNEQNYLWAVELWYAYAIQVKSPDGSIQPALAPFVSLINHSPWPHIVHFSTVDPKTRHLNVKTFRPVHQHQQVYLSYGPLPNSQLLLFYGFAIEGNPFESVDIMLDPQEGGAAVAAEILAPRLQLLQELGLGLQYKLTPQRPTPPGLLAALLVLYCSTIESEAVQNAIGLAGQQQRLQQLGVGAEKGNSSKAEAGDPASTAAAGGSKVAGKKSSKARKSSKGHSRSKQKAVHSSTGSITNPHELQERWDATAVCNEVLGKALSPATEAVVKQALLGLLAEGKAPYEACLARITKRRELQALLLQKQQEQHGMGGGAESNSSSSRQSGEDGFMACADVYLRDIVALYDACERNYGL